MWWCYTYGQIPINHGLLIAKLTYGLDTESLKPTKSYLTTCLQRTKVNTSSSSRSKLPLGVPQRSALRPLLFNNYKNKLFCVTETTNMCDFAVDTTSHACHLNLKRLVIRL